MQRHFLYLTLQIHTFRNQSSPYIASIIQNIKTFNTFIMQNSTHEPTSIHPPNPHDSPKKGHKIRHQTTKKNNSQPSDASLFYNLVEDSLKHLGPRYVHGDLRLRRLILYSKLLVCLGRELEPTSNGKNNTCSRALVLDQGLSAMLYIFFHLATVSFT